MQLAEDLVQDTFVVAAEKIASFRKESLPKTWLFGILNNKIAEHFTKQSKHLSFNVENAESLEYYFNEQGHWKKEFAPNEWTESAEHLLDNEDFNAILQSCLGKLPPQWFLCISMKYLEEKNPQKVCQDLNISPTNYWQIIHRAKIQLRHCIEMNWFQS